MSLRLFKRLIGLLVVVASIYIGGIVNGGPFQPALCTLFSYQCPTINIYGQTAEGFESVKKVFESQFKKGEHVAAQFAASYKGNLVVNIWGSYGDLDYSDDSLQVVYSNTKTMSGLTVAVAVDQGLLNYNDPVSKYWPEFAKHGKDKIRIEDVLRHEAGLPYLKTPLTTRQFVERDWDSIAELVADSPQVYPAYTNRTYHIATRDLINNEVIRRVDPKHRTIGVFAKEEIFDKMNAEFHIGTLNESQFHRVLPLTLNHPLHLIFNTLLPYFAQKHNISIFSSLSPTYKQAMKTFIEYPMPITYEEEANIVDILNTPKLWKAELHSTGGITNAKSAAKIASMMAHGGKFGNITILSEKTMKEAISDVQIRLDSAGDSYTAMSKGGFAEYGKLEILGNWKKGFFGWFGFGGSIIAFNPEEDISFSFIPTGLKMGALGDERGYELIEELLACIANK